MTPINDSDATVVGIVRQDYESLSSIIGRIEGYRDVLRGVTLTLWTAAIGLGVASRSAMPLLGAAVLVALLAWADLRLGYQYGVAHRRSIELEAIVDSFVKRVLESGRLLEAEAQERLDDVLAQYQFGSNLNMMRPAARKVLVAREVMGWPTVLYALLIMMLVGALFVV